MSLTELITGVEAHEMVLTVFNADSDAADDLRERFADRNLIVTEGTTIDGPEEYVVLSKGEEFITAASLDEIRNPTLDADPHFEGGRHRAILDHLDETMFTSYDAKQMVAASREIEDRAWRIGAGQLHAGFQNISIIESQLDVYEQLASKRNLDVHAYGYPDIDVPSHEGFTVHIERAEEIARSWFVIYDGAGVDSNKCALLAEEREPREFYGFWTYDPSTVDWILDHLNSTYGMVETDGGR
ncbi:DICT sensory domain-containing protein [Halomarina oriensis]|uniref:Histidine kinase n=1 Tax=Halomarina oriensis TaxID=671145 RepID=A0A6B0GSV7_9EURY|nr:DICT sensory domain-containing protein [Halomarina oriensis]MWG36417.1 histidine kinase [Halomarina oriensis]